MHKRKKNKVIRVFEGFAGYGGIIRKTKCSRIFKRSVQSSKTKCPLSRRENLSFQV